MTIKKRILPMLMSLVMVFAMMPMSAGVALAEGTPTEVNSITVTGIRPTTGQTFADAVSNVRVYGDGFTVKRIEWCEKCELDDNNNIIVKQDSDHLGEHGVFNPKYQYHLIVEVEAMDGYILPRRGNNKNYLGHIINYYIGTGVSVTNYLSDDQKTAKFVLTGIRAYTTINVSRPKTGMDVAPTVSLPELESSWYSIESAEWCDESGENKSPTKKFNEGETGYIIAHLKSNDSIYNWYQKPDTKIIKISGGDLIKILDQITYDKLDVLMSVKAAAPTTSLGDIIIDLNNEGTSLTGYELEAVSSTMMELEKRGEVGIPNYQAYDLDNDGVMDVYFDNMWTQDGNAYSRYYAAEKCSIENGYTLTIPDEVKNKLLEKGFAYCDRIIFKTKETTDISGATVTGVSDKTYTGKAQTQTPTVKLDVNGTEVTLKQDTDYTVSYENNTNAGTATMIITGKGGFNGTISKSFNINKAANPLKISPKTATIKYKTLKKKTQTLAATKVIKFKKQINDKKNYTLSSAKKGKKSFKKYFKISKTTGKVTIKKNKKMKKGSYKVKVKIKALGNSNYKDSSAKTTTFTVKVK